MDISEEHLRHCMLYEFKTGNSAAGETKNIGFVYGMNVLNDRKCQRWFAKFSSADFNLSDRPRSGSPKSIDENAIKNAVKANSTWTSIELGQQFNTAHATIISCLHKLGKMSKLGHWVPHDLTNTQRNQRLAVCTSLPTRNHRGPFLPRIVTGDE